MNEQILIIAILFAYLVVGLLPSYRLADEDGFLIANRRLQYVGSGLSIIASKIGGGLFVTYSALFFLYGYPALWFFIGNALGYIVFYFGIKGMLGDLAGLKKGKKGERVYSIADLFHRRVGKKSAVAVGVLIFFSMGGWVITNLTVGSQIISQMTDVNPVFVSVVISIVVVSYLLYGGFFSVVRTDVIQAIMIMILLAVVTMFLWGSDQNIPGEFVPAQQIGSTQIASFFVVGFLFPFGSAELYQRIIACDSVADARRSLIISAALYLMAGLLLTLICAAVAGIESIEDVQSDLRLSLGLTEHLNEYAPYLALAWIIAFISVVISSVDTFIFSSSAGLVQDVFGRLGLSPSEKFKSHIRVTVILVALAGVIISAFEFDVAKIALIFVSITLVLSALCVLLRFRETVHISDGSMLWILVLIFPAILYSIVALATDGGPAFVLVGFFSVLFAALLWRLGVSVRRLKK